MDKTRLQLFLEIVRAAYLGADFKHRGRIFKLKPALLTPYDFIRKIPSPRSDLEELLASLDLEFKSEAKTELYRTGRGWIEHGIKGYDGIRIRRIKFGKKVFLIPVLSKTAVGIDSSSIENTSTVLGFCFFSDPSAGYAYIEKHLNLPKAKEPSEYKWRKLKPELRCLVPKNLDLLLHICCESALIIHTNALISPVEGKRSNTIINLIDGCFTGYESLGSQRTNLRSRLFNLANGIQVHCDPDFAPLTPNKIVRYLVETLAKNAYGTIQPFTPLHATLKSHESIPIQVADMIVGAITRKIRQKEIPPRPFTEQFFDMRKIRHLGKTKWAKAYIWSS